MKLLKNLFVLSIACILLSVSLNGVLQNEVSDYDKYRVIKCALEVENPGQNVIYSITQLGNPIDVCEVMELFFRVGNEIERNQIVNYLSTKGAFIDGNGRPVLHVAASLPNQAQACRIIKFLLQVFGSQYVNQQDSAGQTPLHIAAFAGHEQVIKCLLENRADATISTHKGKLAFELAHNADHKVIRDYLSSLYQELVIKKNSGFSYNITDLKNRTICYSNL